MTAIAKAGYSSPHNGLLSDARTKLTVPFTILRWIAMPTVKAKRHEEGQGGRRAAW